MANKIFLSVVVANSFSGNSVNSLPCDFSGKIKFSENITKW